MGTTITNRDCGQCVHGRVKRIEEVKEHGYSIHYHDCTPLYQYYPITFVANNGEVRGVKCKHFSGAEA